MKPSTPPAIPTPDQATPALASPARPVLEPANILRGVDWASYVRMRDHRLNGHLRMSYIDGTLIVMAPEIVHDRYGRRLALVIDEVTEAWGIFVEGIATTTLRRKREGRRKGTGKEPDYSFYFGDNARRMHHRDDLDLDVAPPPGLAIEVDYKADSSKALHLYARLLVPEVWRCRPDSKRLSIGRLTGDHYEPSERSLALPRLSPDLIGVALAKIEELGSGPAKPWLREWARGLPDPVA